MKKLDLSGQNFGNWAVLYQDSNGRKNGKTAWFCKCQCGSGIIKSIQTGNLVNGNSTGCGCNRKRLRPFEGLYRRLRDFSALKRGIEFDLSYEQFLTFTHKTFCYYCHADIKWTEYNLTWNGQAHNLDRKDNSKGYIFENCVVCCSRCNKGKNSLFSSEEWYEMTECFRKRNPK